MTTSCHATLFAARSDCSWANEWQRSAPGLLNTSRFPTLPKSVPCVHSSFPRDSLEIFLFSLLRTEPAGQAGTSSGTWARIKNNLQGVVCQGAPGFSPVTAHLYPPQYKGTQWNVGCAAGATPGPLECMSPGSSIQPLCIQSGTHIPVVSSSLPVSLPCLSFCSSGPVNVSTKALLKPWPRHVPLLKELDVKSVQSVRNQCEKQKLCSMSVEKRCSAA